MTYADQLRESHRIGAIRPAAPDERPPLPIAPAPPAAVREADAGPAPGRVVRVETRYSGNVPAVRRIDSSGRVLWDGVASALGWKPGLAIAVATGPAHWVTLRSADRMAGPGDRRTAHLDCKGRLVVPLGVRQYLAAEMGEEIVLRADADAGTLQIANASVLALALDVLDRVEASAGSAPSPR